MSPRGHIPIRMCIGCGSRKAKGDLIRLGRAGTDSPSGDAREPGGKGFYLCPDPACLVAARKKLKRRGFAGGLDLAVLESRGVPDKERQEEENDKG
jgi:predicted RNA-binding protein YlxR (DUF448 family)